MDENGKYTLLRMELGKMLGYDLIGLLGASDEELVEKVGKRLMPEGMEWPRFETGEPVRFGDVVSDGDETGRVYYVTFDTVNPVIIGFTDETPDQDSGTWLEVSVNDGERVKRTAPKVLDADGVEIRVGDTVYLLPGEWCDKLPLYRCNGWDEMEVINIAPVHNSDRIECKTLAKAIVCYPQPSQLTHRAPVLAADGRPLREGETVWRVKNGDGPYHVQEIRDGVSVCVEETSCEFMPRELTHERPVADTWERIEDDVMMDATDYCDAHGIEPKYPNHRGKAKCEDLVRRCKALEERERRGA